MQKLVLYLIGPLIPVVSVAVFSVLGSSRLVYTDGYSDPFVPYEAMMPGQSVVASGEYPCDSKVTPGYIETIFCEIYSRTGPFVTVSSSIHDGNFVHTWFSARNLSIGDVVARWGRPDVVVTYNTRSFYVLWGDQGLIGIIDPAGPIGLFNYMLPVENFTISLIPNALP